jgi:hypothetical protein
MANVACKIGLPPDLALAGLSRAENEALWLRRLDFHGDDSYGIAAVKLIAISPRREACSQSPDA